MTTMASTLTDVFGGESQVKGLLCQKALQTLQAAEFGKKKKKMLSFFFSFFFSESSSSNSSPEFSRKEYSEYRSLTTLSGISI